MDLETEFVAVLKTKLSRAVWKVLMQDVRDGRMANAKDVSEWGPRRKGRAQRL